MRVGRLLLSVASLIAFFFAPSAFGQQATASGAQAPPRDPQALALLQQSLAALTGGQSIADVTLSGTARRIAGSDDETGAAVLKALASGSVRIDLSLSSGQRSEIANFAAANPTGAWYGPDGISHPIAFHNLLTEPAWFFPAFAISRRLSTSRYVLTYIGQETHDGQTVEHVSVSQTSSFKDPPHTPSFAHLTQVDFFLDSTTLLPAVITFNIHPDSNALLDLPVEIRFSDYRPVPSASSNLGAGLSPSPSPQIPFHIQKFLNNSLLLDFQAETVTPNSGLSSASFTVAASLSPPHGVVAASSSRHSSPAIAAVEL